MSDIPACAHTKIKEISWREDHATSSKFMCLNCNTDFIPLSPDVRAFLWEKQWTPAQVEYDLDKPAPQ